jgi:hypothetical protein
VTSGRTDELRQKDEKENRSFWIQDVSRAARIPPPASARLKSCGLPVLTTSHGASPFKPLRKV